MFFFALQAWVEIKTQSSNWEWDFEKVSAYETLTSILRNSKTLPYILVGQDFHPQQLKSKHHIFTLMIIGFVAK